MSKVALLFLVRGAVHHEPIWRSWFEGAAGWVPKNTAFALCSDPASKDCARLLEQAGSKHPDVLSRQHLFSVHVHAGPDFKGYPQGHVFAKTLLDTSVKVRWGQHSGIDAVRLLLAAALADPANQRFQILCEVTVPLYPPGAVYSHMLAEQKSRVAACDHPDNLWSTQWDSLNELWRRWSPLLAVGNLTFRTFHKSSQFPLMIRRHAQLVADDVLYDASFRQHCYVGQDEALGRFRDCMSDEHYVSSLLAAKGEGHNTDCVGMAIHSNHSTGEPHPQTYNASAVTTATLQGIRNDGWHQQQDCADKLLISAQSVPTGSFFQGN
eukprot:jgi/Astpho2/9530/Aster-x1582